MPIKDFPPPLLIGSTTTYNESPQLFFCRLVPGGRARTWESVRGISGFPQHGYFPPTHPLCPPTFPPTLFRETLVSHGTNQDHQPLKSPSPQRVWDIQRPNRTYSERRGWDSNPRGCYPYTISSRARSTGLCHLSTRPQAFPQFKGRRPGNPLHAPEAIDAVVWKV